MDETDRLADEAGDEIYKHLEALSLIFVAGAELTLVVRHPAAPGTMDAVFTTESDLRYPEHVLTVRRRMARTPVGRKWQ
jgi:hypothetical protein